MGLLFFYLFLALGISFLCSIMESVLLSTTLSFIQTREEKGYKSARLLKNFKLKIDRPLSAILALNTVAHTVGAAGVGAQAVKVFGQASFGIVSAVLTLLILVITEIIPKTIGALYWRELALTAARIIRVMVVIAWPLVIFAELITRFISRNKQHQSISRDEIAVLTNLGTREGVFEEHESKVITNMIRLKDVKVKEIMTPRTVMTVAPEDMTLGRFFHNKNFLTYSRIPLFRGNIDDITGYVLKDSVLNKLAEDRHHMKLSELKRPFIVAYENVAVPVIFEQMLVQKEHIALVVDEYGGTRGLVTMEDIIETLLGLEIVDESDKITDMQRLALEKWRRRRKKK